MSFIAIDLKVIEGLAASAARASGATEDRVLAGLVRTWHRCWASSADVMTRSALAGVFGGDRLDELIEALTEFGFLEPRGDNSWRIKGAAKYLRIQAGRVLGGKKAAAAGNLRRGRKSLKSAKGAVSPQLVPASDDSGSNAASKSPAELELSSSCLPAALQLPPRLSPNTEHRTPNTEHAKEDLPHLIQAAWNAERKPPLPKWSDTKGKRLTHANARLEEHPEPVFWRDLMLRILRSDFLSGRKTDFKATPDWIINPSNLTKVLEGNYDGNGPPKGSVIHGQQAWGPDDDFLAGLSGAP